MKKKLLSVLLCAVLALGLLPAPARASSYPVDTLVDSGIMLRRISDGADVPFTYPKTGTTVLVIYRDDPASAELLGGLAQCAWAEDERLNVVTMDASGRSRKAAQQFLADSGAAGLADLAYYSDSDPTYLDHRYNRLLKTDDEPVEYAYVLIVQPIGGTRCVRGSLKGVSSAEAVKQELNRWVDFPPDPVTAPVITSQPHDTAAVAGGTASFRVTVSGQELNYRWYVQAPGRGWAAATGRGCQTEELTVSAAMALSGARYRCEVWNGAGSVTSDAASLTVEELDPGPRAHTHDVYRIGALTLSDTEGNPLTSIPRRCFRVTVPITKQAGNTGATVILAAGTTGGYVFLMKAFLKDDAVGQTSTFVLPVNNEKGTITSLIAVPIASIENPILCGKPVSYP